MRERTSWPSRIITFAAVAGPPLGLLLAMGLLWGVAAGPVDLVLFFAMYVICGLGISLGFHRYFTHRSFQARPWFKVTLAILGSMTLQGPVTQWVTDHRKHHALSDQPGDPHSPHTHDGDTWMATCSACGTRTSAGCSARRAWSAATTTAATCSRIRRSASSTASTSSGSRSRSRSRS